MRGGKERFNRGTRHKERGNRNRTKGRKSRSKTGFGSKLGSDRSSLKIKENKLSKKPNSRSNVLKN